MSLRSILHNCSPQKLQVSLALYVQESLVKGFKCGYCDSWHEELPLDIAFKRPASYFAIPEDQLEDRVWESRYFTKIDDCDFFVRGLIFVPVTDHDEDFCWGTWAKVDQDSYDYIWDTWEDDAEGKVLIGVLDIEIPTYDDVFQLEVEIHLHGVEEHPTFVIKNTTTKLGLEQTKGINIERALAISHEVLG
jgi:hypothetical protein